MQLDRLRRRLHSQLDPSAWPGRGLSPLNKLLVACILLATIIAIVETERGIAHAYSELFGVLEMSLGVLFAAEYFARLWSVVERQTPGESAARQRIKFALTPSALLDLFTVVVTLLPFLTINVLAFRLVRLLRILRLAKLGRMSAAFRLLYDVVRSRRYELVVTFALASTVLVLGASALYWIEGDIQPTQFGSIPRALWWAVITLTTIGYGDAYPITAAGKLVATMVAVAGNGLIALPKGIIASAFSQAIRKQK
jgi:voltage-gated potassium channel